MKFDIHKFKHKLDSELKKIKKSKDVCDENKKIILDFYRDCVVNGLSIVRIWKYLYHMRFIAMFFKKSFKEVTKDDVISFIEYIEKKDYSLWTKHDNKIALKKFYKWLNGGEYPEVVKWVNTNFNRNNNRLPEELLTPEDIMKLTDVAEIPRDKALVFVLYESGCRIGELLSLSIKNVRFDEYGAILIVNGKTGMRRVRIIASAPILANWLNHHPLKNDLEAPLWIIFEASHKYEPMTYSATQDTLKRLAKRAGIKKRINPHSFRHARATYLANKLTEAQMKEYFGWVQGSDMASVYVHLSGRDVDGALLKLHGLVKEEKKDDELQLRICERCQEKNSPAQQFCGRCGSPLSIKIALSVEEKYRKSDELSYLIFKELIKRNPAIEKEIFEAIKRLGINLSGIETDK